ncbi:MAG: radical SAM protein, partial [Candidatus Omnitrophica bacterium]|nr:radical SAM protein [Candidatus Omnitrophota bacterium]
QPAADELEAANKILHQAFNRLPSRCIDYVYLIDIFTPFYLPFLRGRASKYGFDSLPGFSAAISSGSAQWAPGELDYLGGVLVGSLSTQEGGYTYPIAVEGQYFLNNVLNDLIDSRLKGQERCIRIKTFGCGCSTPHEILDVLLLVNNALSARQDTSVEEWEIELYIYDIYPTFLSLNKKYFRERFSPEDFPIKKLSIMHRYADFTDPQQKEHIFSEKTDILLYRDTFSSSTLPQENQGFLAQLLANVRPGGALVYKDYGEEKVVRVEPARVVAAAGRQASFLFEAPFLLAEAAAEGFIQSLEAYNRSWWKLAAIQAQAGISLSAAFCRQFTVVPGYLFTHSSHAISALGQFVAAEKYPEYNSQFTYIGKALYTLVKRAQQQGLLNSRVIPGRFQVARRSFFGTRWNIAPSGTREDARQIIFQLLKDTDYDPGFVFNQIDLHEQYEDEDQALLAQICSFGIYKNGYSKGEVFLLDCANRSRVSARVGVLGRNVLLESADQLLGSFGYNIAESEEGVASLFIHSLKAADPFQFERKDERRLLCVGYRLLQQAVRLSMELQTCGAIHLSCSVKNPGGLAFYDSLLDIGLYRKGEGWREQWYFLNAEDATRFICGIDAKIAQREAARGAIPLTTRVFLGHLHYPAITRQVVSWLATNRCPYHCIFCGNGPLSGQLSTEQSRALIDRVRVVAPMANVFIFSGGEPMLRADLPELIDYAHALGFQVRINTSGTPLRKEVLSRVKEYSGKLRLSLHSGSSGMEDMLTGGKGHLGAAEKALEVFSEYGIPTTVVTVATAINYEVIPAMAQLLARYPLEAWRIQQFVCRGRGAELGDDLTISKEKFAALRENIVEQPFPVLFIKTESPMYERYFQLGLSGEVILTEFSLRRELSLGNIFEMNGPDDLLERESSAVAAYLQESLAIERRHPVSQEQTSGIRLSGDIYPEISPITADVIHDIQLTLMQVGIPSLEILLFGSYAEGNNNPHDLDLIIMFAPGTTFEQAREIIYQLDRVEKQIIILLGTKGYHKVEIHDLNPATRENYFTLWRTGQFFVRNRFLWFVTSNSIEGYRWPGDKIVGAFSDHRPISTGAISDRIGNQIIARGEEPGKGSEDVPHPITSGAMRRAAENYRQSDELEVAAGFDHLAEALERYEAQLAANAEQRGPPEIIDFPEIGPQDSRNLVAWRDTQGNIHWNIPEKDLPEWLAKQIRIHEEQPTEELAIKEQAKDFISWYDSYCQSDRKFWFSNGAEESFYWKVFSCFEPASQQALCEMSTALEGLLPQEGRLLDLMSGKSSWFERRCGLEVLGVGLVEQSMAKNPVLSAYRVHDLNHDPAIPFEGTFDAVLISLGIMYLSHPIQVLRNALRQMKPGARLIITYFDYYGGFNTQATAGIWKFPFRYGFAARSELLQYYFSGTGLVAPQTQRKVSFNKGNTVLEYAEKIAIPEPNLVATSSLRRGNAQAPVLEGWPQAQGSNIELFKSICGEKGADEYSFDGQKFSLPFEFVASDLEGDDQGTPVLRNPYRLSEPLQDELKFRAYLRFRGVPGEEALELQQGQFPGNYPVDPNNNPFSRLDVELDSLRLKRDFASRYSSRPVRIYEINVAKKMNELRLSNPQATLEDILSIDELNWLAGQEITHIWLMGEKERDYAAEGIALAAGKEGASPYALKSNRTDERWGGQAAHNALVVKLGKYNMALAGDYVTNHFGFVSDFVRLFPQLFIIRDKNDQRVLRWRDGRQEVNSDYWFDYDQWAEQWMRDHPGNPQALISHLEGKVILRAQEQSWGGGTRSLGTGDVAQLSIHHPDALDILTSLVAEAASWVCGPDGLGAGMLRFDLAHYLWRNNLRERVAGFLDADELRQFDGNYCQIEPWKLITSRVKVRFPSLIMIAEVFGGAQPNADLLALGFDYAYDKERGFYDLAVERRHTQALNVHLRVLELMRRAGLYVLIFDENHDELAATAAFAYDYAGHAATLFLQRLTGISQLIFCGEEDGHIRVKNNAEDARPDGYDRQRRKIYDHPLLMHQALLHGKRTPLAVINGNGQEGCIAAYLLEDEGRYYIGAVNISRETATGTIYRDLTKEFAETPAETTFLLRDLAYPYNQGPRKGGLIEYPAAGQESLYVRSLDELKTLQLALEPNQVQFFEVLPFPGTVRPSLCPISRISSRETAEEEGYPLRVWSLNQLICPSQERLMRMQRAVAAGRPDILLLQEVTETREVNTAVEMARVFWSDDWSQGEEEHFTRNFEDNREGIGIVWSKRLRGVKSRVYRFPLEGPGNRYLLGIQLEVAATGRRLYAFTTHLPAYLHDRPVREKQILQIAAYLKIYVFADDPEATVILAGDFNFADSLEIQSAAKALERLGFADAEEVFSPGGYAVTHEPQADNPHISDFDRSYFPARSCDRVYLRCGAVQIEVCDFAIILKGPQEVISDHYLPQAVLRLSPPSDSVLPSVVQSES